MSTMTRRNKLKMKQMRISNSTIRGNTVRCRWMPRNWGMMRSTKSIKGITTWSRSNHRMGQARKIEKMPTKLDNKNSSRRLEGHQVISSITTFQVVLKTLMRSGLGEINSSNTSQPPIMIGTMTVQHLGTILISWKLWPKILLTKNLDRI